MSDVEAPFSAGLTWPVILERAMEGAARAHADGRSLDDVLLDIEGHLRLAYDRGQQDERAAVVAYLRWLASKEPDPIFTAPHQAGLNIMRHAWGLAADRIKEGEHHA